MARLPPITAYGGGGFRVAGTTFTGSVLVLPDGPRGWPVEAMTGLTLDSLASVIAAAAAIELLLIGCGKSLMPIPRPIRDGLAAHGVRVEGMDTGAACRTFNVLAAEERRIAAALIAV